MPVIEVSHIHKSYRDHVAVEDISFSVEPGEIFGIVGPNGAGKTTTVECVEGVRNPDRGTVRVLGLDPRTDRAELRQRLGVQLQQGQLPDRLRVAEALELYASFYRRPADWRALADDLGLSPKLRTPFGKLSGGQQQRLSIALAPGRRPRGGRARRAHHRPRPTGPPGHLGPHPRHPGSRRHGAARHPLHG
jgi:ABC-2 type transport system ATP-binding protein